MQSLRVSFEFEQILITMDERTGDGKDVDHLDLRTLEWQWELGNAQQRKSDEQ